MYSLKDFVEKDLVLHCSYTEARVIANELKKENIDTNVISNMITILDTEYYLEVENNTLIRLCDDYIDDMYEQHHIIEFKDIEINEGCCKCKHKDEFQLNEVVHVFISEFLGTGKHITAYISAIDRESNMCEICFLHEKHQAIWVQFSDVHHIEHIYGNFVGDVDA